MNKNNLGNLIKNSRIERGMSQGELAKKLFVTRQAVSSWERGTSFPDGRTLEGLCRELDLDLELLLVCKSNNIGNLVEIKTLMKNDRKRQRLIFLGIFSLFAVVFVVILGILIFFRNEVYVYKVSIDSNEFTLNNSVLIKSKEEHYFQFGNLTSSVFNPDDIIKVSLYYKHKENRKLIIERAYDKDIGFSIQEKYGYNEYFGNVEEKNDIYLDISLNDNGEFLTFTYLLVLEQIIGENRLVNQRVAPIGYDNTIENEAQVVTLNVENLLKNNYKIDQSGNYVKSNKKESFVYYSDNSDFWYSFKDNNIGISLIYDVSWNCISGNSYNYKTAEKIIDFVYFINSNEINCSGDSCEDYQRYLDIILNEYKILL